ncbi:MAG: hypothetical protein H8D23_27195 [Candidatus Brocadiales bacterium]|nr:hypothetical protein [Candidatus Brocadiales bacterium]
MIDRQNAKSMSLQKLGDLYIEREEFILSATRDLEKGSCPKGSHEYQSIKNSIMKAESDMRFLQTLMDNFESKTPS